MPTLEIDQQTDEAITFAARVAGVSKPEIISRLVRLYSQPNEDEESDASQSHALHGVPIHMDYEGHRTEAVFDRKTHRVEIISGPLAGQAFKSPSGAARAVVSDANPAVSPHRNGWNSWAVTKTGDLLQSLRRG